MRREASLYSGSGDNIVCRLCAQRCRIQVGERGRCGVRQNIEGRLYSLVYGELVAEHIDPIEKKPLFHVLPGSSSLSISTTGCNFHCKHCQNSSISQVQHLSPAELRGRRARPAEVAERALSQGCQTISYTYVEPTVFFEFALDCAGEAKQRGIGNVFVSNGYLSREATDTIAPYLDGINIDIKAFSDSFYNDVCGAKLQPVLDCVTDMKERGVWVEVTTLVIPGYNDSSEELAEIASFLVSVDPDIPWHVTGFHPMYRMTDPVPTPVATLSRARRIGMEQGLHFVYQGNVPGSGGENTHCPGCGSLVVERMGFSIRRNLMIKGRCPDCTTLLPGIWKD